MLGSVNGNTDYSFTQVENSFTNVKTSEVVAGYIGRNYGANSEDVEPEQIGSKAKDDKNLDNVVKFKDENKKDKIKEEIEEEENALEKSKEDIKEMVHFLGSKSDDEDKVELGIAYGSDLSDLTRSFKSLAAAVSANDDRVTKSQLVSLLQNLSTKISSDADFKDEIAFIKNLIARFDTISKGKGYITSFAGVNDIQDVHTITPEQVMPPIDIRI